MTSSRDATFNGISIQKMSDFLLGKPGSLFAMEKETLSKSLELSTAIMTNNIDSIDSITKEMGKNDNFKNKGLAVLLQVAKTGDVNMTQTVANNLDNAELGMGMINCCLNSLIAKNRNRFMNSSSASKDTELSTLQKIKDTLDNAITANNIKGSESNPGPTY